MNSYTAIGLDVEEVKVEKEDEKAKDVEDSVPLQIVDCFIMEIIFEITS